MLVSEFFIRKIARFILNFLTSLFNAVIQLFNDFKRVVAKLSVFGT
ncbi:hypothetical protein N407_08730 [Helicobacter pylori FD662]|nr:hypothetical protein N407_08730 [Helicobacter pylori FD662]